MRNQKLWLLISVFVMVAMLATACAPAATPVPTQPAPTETQAPAPTQPPAPTNTTAPVATTAPAATATTASAPTQAPKAITFGYILVGPYNDSGWSQATYDGGQYVVNKLPGTKMIYIDNAFSHQGTTPAQLAEQLLAQGANVIIFNSDSFMDDSNTFAAAHPDIPTIMLSGDQNWARRPGL